MLLQSIKAVNLLVLVLFLGCAFYSLHVHSESPPDNTGALTVVESLDDEDDGIVSVEENGVEEQKSPQEYEVFYPTKEWKTVKPGQAIPRGLHVRLNMQTGDREAKLLEGQTGYKYWESGSHQGMVNPDKKAFTREELKRALKDFKSNVDGGGQDEKSAAKVKEKYKSYDELKKDFEKLNMAIKTDGEVITELYEGLKKAGEDTAMKTVVLEELEYHLHKIDSAVMFCDLGGMPILLACLNDTSPTVQEIAALVLGGALQSNPQVQVSAIDHGAMQQLLKLMSLSSSASLQKKVLFALSSLARHFPFAQKKFLELGGLAPLKKLFEDVGVDSHKLQIKAITFLNDLLMEKDLSEKHTDTENTVDMERLNQYRQINLKSSMHEGGWCKLIPQLLKSQDHDAREKVLHAMSTLVSDCRKTFTSSVSDLERLKKEYDLLASEEKTDDGDDYFTGIANLVATMLSSVRLHDEF